MDFGKCLLCNICNVFANYVSRNRNWKKTCQFYPFIRLYWCVLLRFFLVGEVSLPSVRRIFKHKSVIRFILVIMECLPIYHTKVLCLLENRRLSTCPIHMAFLLRQLKDIRLLVYCLCHKNYSQKQKIRIPFLYILM